MSKPTILTVDDDPMVSSAITRVERHGGTITIDSRPGETVMRVRIPLRPAGPRLNL